MPQIHFKDEYTNIGDTPVCNIILFCFVCLWYVIFIYIHVKKAKGKTTSRVNSSKFSACAFLKGFILTGTNLKQWSYKSQIMPKMMLVKHDWF